MKWLLVCFVATSFHYSALCVAPLFWIANLKISRGTWLIFVMIEVALSQVSDYIVQMVYFLPEFMSYYSIYLNDTKYMGNAGDYIVLLMLNALVFICLYIRKGENRPKIIDVSLFFLMTSCIILILSFPTGNIFKRLNIYFLFYIIFVLPWFLNYFRTFSQKAIAKICLSGILVIYFYYYISPGTLQLYPYKFSF